jgi:multimeric flavodoxin WrbA
MFLSIIVGSSRNDSQSAKVGQYIDKALTTDHALYSVKELFPKLWDNLEFESLHEKALAYNSTVYETLAKSDGFIFVVPEWNGMVPPAMKNVFIIADREFAHKPALLVTVSAGFGGSYPIAELRMSSYKNSRLCYIPDHVIVRHVNAVMNTPEPADADDKRIRDRLAYSIRVLEEYTKAFQAIRNSGVIDLDLHPSGM